MKRDVPRSTVEVWRVPLSQPEGILERLGALLSPGESRRAVRFHFEKDRKRYTVARGALRMILADCLGTEPEDLQFRHGRYGKPYLARPQSEPVTSQQLQVSQALAQETELNFNLSHCEDLALVAVSAERMVGVDIEKIRKVGELNLIVERYFSDPEKRFLDSVQPSDRDRALLTLWSRREAAAKAFGLDLAAALSRIRLPLYPPGGSRPLRHLADMETDRGATSPLWSILDLQIDDKHVGALCAEGTSPTVELRDFRL